MYRSPNVEELRAGVTASSWGCMEGFSEEEEEGAFVLNSKDG